MTQNKCSNKVFSSSYVNPYSCKIYRNTEILSNLPSSNSNLNRLNSEVQSKDQPYPKIQFKGYLDNLPSSEFQSLVLESMTNTSMDEAAGESSHALSSLMEKGTEMSRKYLEELEKLENDAVNSLEIEPEAFLSKQTKFFDQLKVFLTAQRISLRQNLILLENKTTKFKELQGKLKHFDNNCNLEKEGEQVLQENRELEALRQWGSPIDGKNDVQICPVCGIDIDTSENENTLEEHVVAHWCPSSESEPI